MAGQLRVDEITDEAGTGSPSFPQKITPSSLGTGTPTAAKVLNGAGEWVDGTSPGELLLLQEDTFTTSGTWTKASGYDANDTVMIFLVGGGASGRAARTSVGQGSCRGGNCGSGAAIACRYADMPSSSFTLTVGAGGAAVTVTADTSAAGVGGGRTTFSNDTARIFLELQGGAAPADATNRQTTTSRVLLLNGIGNAEVSNGSLLDANALSFSGTSCQQYHASTSATPVGEYASQNDSFKGRSGNLPQQIFGSGGSAARDGATNRTSWNPKVPALFATGGDGSGTENGQDGAFPGGGGGGCFRLNENATSGAGGAGGMIVQYYRGRVSVYQVMTAMER